MNIYGVMKRRDMAQDRLDRLVRNPDGSDRWLTTVEEDHVRALIDEIDQLDARLDQMSRWKKR